MTTDIDQAAIHPARPAARRWWSLITALLLAALFIQAIFAGAMMSGLGWARAAHAMSALVLIIWTITAGLAALVTLRRIAGGSKLGLTLLALGVAVLLQTALGRMSAHGAGLLWVHVPLGVALVGLAAQAAAGARRLGGD